MHRPKFEDNKVDSNEQENYVNDDCSHLASEKMNKYGFTIKARAIYDHSLRFYSFYLLVKVLFEEWSKEKYSLFLPDFNDVLLGKYEMPSNFSEVLEESRNKLRKLK